MILAFEHPGERALLRDRPRLIVPFGLVVALVSDLAGCDSGVTARPTRIVAEDAVDQPLRGATTDDRAAFNEGDARFDAVFNSVDGLGPLYIRTACSACHSEAGRGPGLVEKMSPTDSSLPPSMREAALPYGPTIRPFVAGGGKTPLVPPDGGWGLSLTRSVRVGPALWGRGYVDAVAGPEIERVEREQSERTDAIRGRINRVIYHSVGTADPRYGNHDLGQANLIGRFGLKARVATLDDFTADALQGDMGITSPLRPTELPNPDGITDDALPGVDVELALVDEIAVYVRMIEIPSRDVEAATAEARALFDQVLCGTCHVSTLRTRTDYPIALLADRDAPIYSDLLLHDMGDALADGVLDESASGSEWKTAPLIGLRFFRAYLHDGRAHSVDEAIRMHAGAGSQAGDSVALYQALEEAQRATLLRFVTSL